MCLFSSSSTTLPPRPPSPLPARPCAAVWHAFHIVLVGHCGHDVTLTHAGDIPILLLNPFALGFLGHPARATPKEHEDHHTYPRCVLLCVCVCVHMVLCWLSTCLCVRCWLWLFGVERLRAGSRIALTR